MSGQVGECVNICKIINKYVSEEKRKKSSESFGANGTNFLQFI